MKAVTKIRLMMECHLNHGDVIGAVPDGQGVHTQLLFHKADKVAGGEQSNYNLVPWS